MLFGRQAPRVLVYEHPVDMRKSFDGPKATGTGQGNWALPIARQLVQGKATGTGQLFIRFIL
jgi:hypothetical protein